MALNLLVHNFRQAFHCSDANQGGICFSFYSFPLYIGCFSHTWTRFMCWGNTVCLVEISFALLSQIICTALNIDTKMLPSRNSIIFRARMRLSYHLTSRSTSLWSVWVSGDLLPLFPSFSLECSWLSSRWAFWDIQSCGIVSGNKWTSVQWARLHWADLGHKSLKGPWPHRMG